MPVRTANAVWEGNLREGRGNKVALICGAERRTYAQVAELMGAPLNSVKVWIHRARTSLKEQLGR